MEENTIVGESTTEANVVNEQATETNVQASETTLIDPQPEGDQVQDNQTKETDSKEAEKEIEYQDFKLPEGITVDQDMLNDFKLVAKEGKLSQELAQRFIDLQAKHTEKITNQIQSTFKETVETWKQETIKELGPSLKTDQAYIAKAIATFGTPELREILNRTGLGNNIHMVKMLMNAGKNISSDKIIDGKQAGSVDLDTAKKLYPNLN